MEEREIVIIGGGPAGYAAAIRCSHLGGKTTLIESRNLGGTCLNHGCVPAKFLLHTASVYDSIERGAEFGVHASNISVNITEMQERKNQVISNHVSGIEMLLRGARVEYIKGSGRLLPDKQVEFTGADGAKQVIQAKKIIIATGARPVVLPIPGANGPDILAAEAMLDLKKLPKSMVIIGGGVIGVEMATVWGRLGSKISIIEMAPHCLPQQDVEIAKVLEKALTDMGVQIISSARVTRIDDASGCSKTVVFTKDNVEQKVEAEVVAVSVGYQPNSAGLGLEEAGVALNRKAIQVNDMMETSIPDVYAAGNVVGSRLLAYIALFEGRVAAENSMGMRSRIEYEAVPQCIFTMPEVAAVGMTEEEAVEKGIKVLIGRFPFLANSMASVLGEHRGLVKIIAQEEDAKILGVHIIGPQATTVIPEAALALKKGMSARDIAATIHCHPTLSEAFWEAALDVDGNTIHARSRNKRTMPVPSYATYR
jgi:dihydrolipoamide dehydrogenase